MSSRVYTRPRVFFKIHYRLSILVQFPIMELLKRAWRISKGAEEKTDDQSPSLPKNLRRYYEKGRGFVFRHGLDTNLGLSGNDKLLLEMLCGLRFLYREIDISTKVTEFVEKKTRERYRVTEETPWTARVREKVHLFRDSINEFMQDHYTESAIRKARTIMLAVNALFTSIDYVDQTTGKTQAVESPQTLFGWTQEWKLRIHEE